MIIAKKKIGVLSLVLICLFLIQTTSQIQPCSNLTRTELPQSSATYTIENYSDRSLNVSLYNKTLYDAQYSFAYDTIGEVPNDWVKTSLDAYVLGSYQGHSKCVVISNATTTNQAFETTFSSTLAGSVEFYILLKQTTSVFQIGTRNAALSSTNCLMQFSTSGNIYVYDQTSGTVVRTYSANVWYHVRIIYDGTGSTGSYSVWIDGVLEANNFRYYSQPSNGRTTGNLYFRQNTAGAQECIIDAIDTNLDETYETNRNLNLVPVSSLNQTYFNQFSEDYNTQVHPHADKIITTSLTNYYIKNTDLFTSELYEYSEGSDSYSFEPNYVTLINDQDYTTQWEFSEILNESYDEFLFNIDIDHYNELVYTSKPSGINIYNNRIYISQSPAFTFDIYDLAGNLINSFATPNIRSFAINSTGFIHLSQQSNREILIYDYDGNYVSEFNTTIGWNHYDIAFDELNNRIYTSSYNRIRIYDLSWNYIGAFDVDSGARYLSILNGSIVIGNVDTDYIYLYDPSGTKLWEYALTNVKGTSVIDDEIYAIDNIGPSDEHYVRIFNATGTYLRKFRDWSTPTNWSTPTFQSSNVVDMVSDGNMIYTADSQQDVIRIYDIEITRFLGESVTISPISEVNDLGFINVSFSSSDEVIASLNQLQIKRANQSLLIPFDSYLSLQLNFTNEVEILSIEYQLIDVPFKQLILEAKSQKQAIVEQGVFCAVRTYKNNNYENGYLISEVNHHYMNIYDGIIFVSLSNQRGEYKNWENYQIRINNKTIISNYFYGIIGTIYNISIYTNYGGYITSTLHEMNVLTDFNIVSIQLIEYSLKIFNQQLQFAKLNITLDPNYPETYTDLLEWVEWIAPNEIIKFDLSPGYYRVAITEYETATTTTYSYTLNGDDILLISSSNTIFNVLENIENVNTTIGNQITNVAIDISNINSSIGSQIVNVDINLDNINSSLSEILVNQNTTLNTIFSNLDALYIFSESNFLMLNNSINTSFIELQNSIYLINNSIYTAIQSFETNLYNVNNTISGNLSLILQQNDELTAIYLNTMFSRYLDWTNASLNSTYIRDQIAEIEILNQYRNISAEIQFMYDGKLETMLLSAQEAKTMKVPKDSKMRILSLESGEVLEDWQDVQSVDFGFYEDSITKEDLNLTLSDLLFFIMIAIGMGAVFLISFIYTYYKLQGKSPTSTKRKTKSKRRDDRDFLGGA